METFSEYMELLNRKKDTYNFRMKLYSYEREFSDTTGSVNAGSYQSVRNDLDVVYNYTNTSGVWVGADEEMFLSTVDDIRKKLDDQRDLFLLKLKEWDNQLIEEEKNLISQMKECERNMNKIEKGKLEAYRVSVGVKDWMSGL